MTLVEIAISAAALLGLIAAAAIAALTVLNKNAASARLMSNAREICTTQHRSSDRLTFYLDVPRPDIPKTTSASGSAWDETGGSSPVTIYSSRDGTGTDVQGHLTRIVTAESNTPGADIRRVTFRLDYPPTPQTLLGTQV